jgi:enolase
MSKINQLKALGILDSTGNPSVQVAVHLASGAIGDSARFNAREQ